MTRNKSKMRQQELYYLKGLGKQGCVYFNNMKIYFNQSLNLIVLYKIQGVLVGACKGINLPLEENVRTQLTVILYV